MPLRWDRLHDVQVVTLQDEAAGAVVVKAVSRDWWGGGALALLYVE
jgi:hypothetical protein